MELSLEEYRGLQSDNRNRDAELERMRRDCDYWKKRALEAEQQLKLFEQMPLDDARKERPRFLLLSIEKLKTIASKISDAGLLSCLGWLLPKCLADKSPEESYSVISEAIPLPSPTLSLTAQGDVHVAGDLNDVHDNTAVNF